jgi:hypothetical protein
MECPEHKESDFASCSRCLANYWENESRSLRAQLAAEVKRREGAEAEFSLMATAAMAWQTKHAAAEAALAAAERRGMEAEELIASCAPLTWQQTSNYEACVAWEKKAHAFLEAIRAEMEK